MRKLHRSSSKNTEFFAFYFSFVSSGMEWKHLISTSTKSDIHKKRSVSRLQTRRLLKNLIESRYYTSRFMIAHSHCHIIPMINYRNRFSYCSFDPLGRGLEICATFPRRVDACSSQGGTWRRSFYEGSELNSDSRVPIRICKVNTTSRCNRRTASNLIHACVLLPWPSLRNPLDNHRRNYELACIFCQGRQRRACRRSK